MFKHKILSEKEIEREQRDFGLIDEKGRKIGFRWVIFRTESEAADGKTSWTNLPFEYNDFFTARTHVLRDGKAFGALTGDLHALTLDEARSAIYKRLNASIGRYKKQSEVRASLLQKV